MRLGGGDVGGTAQVVFTLTRFRSTKRVPLFVNGRGRCLTTAQNRPVQEPLTRASFRGWHLSGAEVELAAHDAGAERTPPAIAS